NIPKWINSRINNSTSYGNSMNINDSISFRNFNSESHEGTPEQINSQSNYSNLVG
ncbi:321_t:CDS:1, partial [Racocetra persica]